MLKPFCNEQRPHGRCRILPKAADEMDRIYVYISKRTLMKKLILFMIIAGTASLNAGAQQPVAASDCDVKLAVQGKDGSNGVAVAYNPSANVYYTVFAGNDLFPIQLHNTNGASLSTEAIGYDVRGMWYNPAKNCLEGISYNNTCGFELKLNSDGSIADRTATAVSYGMGNQTVAAYAAKERSVLFVEGRTAYFFKPGKKRAKQVELLPKETDIWLNTNGPIYTGVKHYEIGLLDTKSMSVILFNKKGKQTGMVKLNVESCTELQDYPLNFRVSWCNDRVFIFDPDARTWTGYKLF